MAQVIIRAQGMIDSTGRMQSAGSKRAGCLFLLCAVLLAGCSVKAPVLAQGELEAQDREKAAQLEMLLEGLGQKVDVREAKLLARDSIRYAYTLSERYDLVWPPLLHNTLVNVGLKDRGLCYQWADDMQAHMLKSGYKSFDFYLGVSHPGSYFEHNTLVVSAKGAGFSHGVVLDPWRDSGKLFFAKIDEDPKYVWDHREE